MNEPKLNNNNGLVISIADASEINVLADMRMEFAKEAARTYTKKECDQARAAVIKYIKEHIKAGDYIGYIARIGQTPVASAGILVYILPPLMNKLDRSQGHLLNMFTVKKYRRQGIGQELLDYIKKDLKKRGIKRMYLNAYKQATGLYQRVGFKEMDEIAMLQWL